MKIIDMHCDTIMQLMENNQELQEKDNMINIDKLKKGDYLLQCFAMFVHYVKKDQPDYSPFVYCQKMIDKYYQELEKNKETMAPVLKYSDIEKNIQDGKISALLTIEEGGTCLGSLELLRNFYRLGVRMMTLSWNYPNELGYPNVNMLSISQKQEVDPTKPVCFPANTIDGLTEKGKEFVKEMNRLGMIVDCSHMSDKGFYDVIEITNKPIVCSHSNARSICSHCRNMTDDMLYRLKENGGVVGINYCHDFIKDDSSLATIDDVIKHIDYIKNLIGIDHIGLGSDFDGISNEDIELKDASMIPLLFERLKEKGYTDSDLEKIAYKNVLRVFKANFKED